ncbi:hypothetical protein JCM10207_007362 [Rhodosporidiobolus poonsookiae]
MASWSLLRLCVDNNELLHHGWAAATAAMKEDPANAHLSTLLGVGYLLWVELMLERHANLRAVKVMAWQLLVFAVFYVVVFLIPKSLSKVALVVAVVMDQWVFAYTLALILALFAFEVTAYLSVVTLLIGTSSVVVYEFCSTFRRSNRVRLATKRAFAHVRKVTALTAQEMVLSAKLASAEAFLDNAAAQLPDPPRFSSLMKRLLPLATPWGRIIHADPSAVDAAWASLQRRSEWFKTQESLSTLHAAAADTLKDRVHLHRGYREPLTFKATIYELAGIAIGIFRLPRLQHLARPWQFTPFLPFLVTYPGYSLLTRYVNSTEHVPFFRGLSDSADVESLVDVLFNIEVYAPRMPLPTLQSFLSAFLVTQHGAEPVSKAERLSHDAILDAVLDWRLRQLEAQWERDP